MRLANLLTLFAAILIAALIPAHAQFTVTLSNGESYTDSNFGVGKSMEINFTVTGGDIGESQPPPSPPHSSQAAILTPRNSHPSQTSYRDWTSQLTPVFRGFSNL